MNFFNKTFYVLLIYTFLTQNIYASTIDHKDYIGLKKTDKFQNRNNIYKNSFIKQNENYKYDLGFSAHLFYPKASLEKLFETSFGSEMSAAYRIYPKWSAGISISYTRLIPIAKFNETTFIKNGYIFNSSLLLKYRITQEIFLNAKLGELYYSVTTNPSSNMGNKTGKWCPVITLGPSILFTWTKNVGFTLDLSYNAFHIDRSYKYYFLAKITISFVK